MWVDDTVPHEMPASYVKEISEDKSHDKGVKAQRPLLEMTSWREKTLKERLLIVSALNAILCAQIIIVEKKKHNRVQL